MQDQRQKVTSICSECGAPVTFPLGSFQITCEHCQAGLAVEQGTTLVRLDCPNCGGNFFYIDGALTSKCPYCDSAVLVLCQQRLLRYLILPRAKGPDVSADAYLMLLPFWNLRGLLYCWQVGSRSSYEESPHPSSTNDMDGYYSGDDSVPSGSIKVTTGPRKVFGGRVVNLSLPDPATLFYGIGSLRLRASLNPLEPFSQHHESLGEIPPLRLDHVQAKEQLLDLAIKYTASVERLTQIDLQRIDMVADELSLIYYPFWIEKTQNQTKAVWDGVSGEPEPLQPPHEGSMPSVPVLFDHLKVIQLTCGRCSQELAPGNHATVLPCLTRPASVSSLAAT